MAYKFKEYIKNGGFCVDNIEDATHQFLPGAGDPAWKMKIPNEKLLEFLTNYYEYKVKPGYQSSLMERPGKEFNQMRIDLDFRFKMNADGILKPMHYNVKFIKSFIIRLGHSISNYIPIPSKGLKISVFEKEQPTSTPDNKWQKEGLHIVCPDIVLPNNIFHAIRIDLINDSVIQNAVKEIQADNNIEDIIDKSVIDKNCWIMVGSGKPTYTRDNYYKLSKTYNIKGDTESITIDKCELDISDMLDQIIHFSNYKKKVNHKIHSHININELNAKIVSSFKKYTKPIKPIDRLKLHRNDTNRRSEIEIVFIWNLLECLSEKRWSEYGLWFNVGICLYNIGGDFLYDVFRRWSSKWERYNEADVEKEWDTKIRHNHSRYELNIEQLKRYAKEDNYDRYFKIKNDQKRACIDKLIDRISTQPVISDKHKIEKPVGAVDVAKYIGEYIKFCDWVIKCVDVHGNTYVFYRYSTTDGIWKEDKNAHTLHKLFSEEIIPKLTELHKWYAGKLYELEHVSMAQQNSINYNNNNFDDISESSYPLAVRNQDNDASANNLLEIETKKNVYKQRMASIVGLNKFMQQAGNRNNLIKDLANSSSMFDPEFFTQLNENRNIFVCGNCVLDLKTLEIRKGLPEDMSTLRTKINFPLEPSEKDEMYQQDLSDLLDKIYPNFAMQQHIINVFAETLSGVQRREKFHIHTGSGGNGKTVIFDLLHIVFGDYSYTPPATIYSFDNTNPNSVNPTIANCKGPRLIDSEEPKSSTPLNVAGVKNITGGGSMTGRHLNKSPITFKPQATFHLATNDIPDFDGPSDGGIERRIEIINYPSKFVTKGDYRLNDPQKFPNHYEADIKFRKESYLIELAPYFLQLLFNTYKELVKSDFAPILDINQIPDEIKEYTNKYIAESNTIDQYIAECIEHTDGVRQKEKGLWDDFRRYSKDSQSKSYDKKVFFRHFDRRLGISAKRGYYYDICIKGGGEEYE